MTPSYYRKQKRNISNNKKKTRERFIILDGNDDVFTLNDDYYRYNLSNSCNLVKFGQKNDYCNKKMKFQINSNVNHHVHLYGRNDVSLLSRDDDIIKKNERKQQELIDAIIESRKTWPVAITTRAALRMQRYFNDSRPIIGNVNDANCSLLRHCSSSFIDDKSVSIDISSYLKSKNSDPLFLPHLRPDSEINLIKLKLIRILVFGSMGTNNRQDNFLRKCRDNFIIKLDIGEPISSSIMKNIKHSNNLLSIYTINYACGKANVLLELCFIQWPDSFVSKSEFYHQTFGKYFQMTNLALGYYDPNDLESIEHMQSWLKAFYEYHRKNCSFVNSVIIRLDGQRRQSSTRFLFGKRIVNSNFDHVISSLLNQYRSSMHHLNIKYGFFRRRPSLKPLWKILYHLIVLGRVDEQEYQYHGISSDLIIDRVEKVEAKLRRQKHREKLRKFFSRFLRSINNGILRTIKWKNFFL